MRLSNAKSKLPDFKDCLLSSPLSVVCFDFQ